MIFNDNDNDVVSNNLNNEIEDQKMRCTGKLEEGLVNTAYQLCVI